MPGRPPTGLTLDQFEKEFVMTIKTQIRTSICAMLLTLAQFVALNQIMPVGAIGAAMEQAA
jgi:hypothetical protein